MARRKSDKHPDKEGTALWRAVTDSIKPLASRDVAIHQIDSALNPTTDPGSLSTGKKSKKKSGPPMTRSVPPSAPAAPVSRKPEPLEIGKAPGVDKRTAERLKRGKLAIEARIDLHGHTQDSAHHVLNSFITHSHWAGKRCVLVVTGKGKGILQASVPRWLNDPALRPFVLSVNYAQQKDGGTGALYVLLKRNRQIG